MPIEKVIDKILDLQPEGATNLKEVLVKGLEELDKSNLLEREGILITDGEVTLGDNPIKTAERYPKLHVIQVPYGRGGGDSEMCMKLSSAGRGKYTYVNDFNQLPYALIRVLR
jgi:hypothetical protein